jgi:RecA-family ATPase
MKLFGKRVRLKSARYAASLIGRIGTVLDVAAPDEPHLRKRVLVKFDDDLAKLGLDCHNEVPNALWLLPKDLSIAFGMAKYKAVPIAAAKRIAREFDKDQVVIVCRDKKHGKTHVTTYGKSIEDCIQAAKGGNFVKHALGWPESLCNSVPAREQARRKKDSLDTR